MFVSLGLFKPCICFWHIILHGGFKALLFICFGYLIIIRNHSNDLRFSGGGGVLLLIKITMLSCLMSNSGFIFLSGFFSKDLILVRVSNLWWGGCFMSTLYFLVIFTLFYCFRLYSFINKTFNPPQSRVFLPTLFLSFSPLFFLNIFLGWFFKDLLMGLCYVKNFKILTLGAFIIFIFGSFVYYGMKSLFMGSLGGLRWFFNYFSGLVFRGLTVLISFDTGWFLSLIRKLIKSLFYQRSQNLLFSIKVKVAVSFYILFTMFLLI